MHRFCKIVTCLAAILPAFAQMPPDGGPAKPPVFQEPAPVSVPGSALQVDRRLSRFGYPALAQKGRIQGVVRVRTTVGADGRVQGADALDGPRLLQKSAEAMVWSCQFKPPLVQGIAARVVADLDIPFRLSGDQANLPERPVTGFVLHAQTSSAAGAPSLAPGSMEKAAIAGLEKMGLTARDPGTADPATTLDLTLGLNVGLRKSAAGGKAFSQNLVARASLLADHGLEANEPGKPLRVWVIRRDLICGESEMEEACQRLLGPVMQTLVPTPEGVARNLVNFEFSQITVLYAPPAPPYAPLAKANGIQGAVIVEMVIDPTGTPISASALSGPPELRETSERYAMDWRFGPARIDGQAVTARFKLTLNYKLR